MKVFSDPIAFDWDPGNSQKNQEKYGVTNQEAEDLFFNEHKFVFEDSTHSQIEKRYLLLGVTNEARKLAIIFTIETISIRLPKYLLAQIKELANANDVPYQSFMKIILFERVKQEKQLQKCEKTALKTGKIK